MEVARQGCPDSVPVKLHARFGLFAALGREGDVGVDHGATVLDKPLRIDRIKMCATNRGDGQMNVIG